MKNARGKDLCTRIEKGDLIVHTSPPSCLRVENGAQRNTTSDLGLAKHIPPIKWPVTEDSLGRDHLIIELQIRDVHHNRPLGTAKLTNWSLFRREELNETQEPIRDLKTWTSSLKKKYLSTPPRSHLPNGYPQLTSTSLICRILEGVFYDNG